jgi:hypothetical protein
LFSKFAAGIVQAAFTADLEALSSTLQACWQQQQQQQQESLQGPLLRLLSLHVTCFKCCLRTFHASDEPDTRNCSALMDVGWACLRVVQGLSNSSSSTAVQLTSGTAPAVVDPAAAAAAAAAVPAISPAVLSAWLALLARCVTAAVAVIKKQVAAQRVVAERTADADVFTSAVLLCETSLWAFQQQLPHAGVPADALQQLLQELATFVPFADEVLEAHAAAEDDDAVPHALLQLVINHDLLSQLRVFAGRVVAQLPLRWACNHPCCGNLGGASELALVGGKGCVCSGCRSAR